MNRSFFVGDLILIVVGVGCCGKNVDEKATSPSAVVAMREGGMISGVIKAGTEWALPEHATEVWRRQRAATKREEGVTSLPKWQKKGEGLGSVAVYLDDLPRPWKAAPSSQPLRLHFRDGLIEPFH